MGQDTALLYFRIKQLSESHKQDAHNAAILKEVQEFLGRIIDQKVDGYCIRIDAIILYEKLRKV